MTKNPIKIAVVDDHRLFRKGLVELIATIGNEFEVVQQAGNGKEFLEGLNKEALPDIVILDMHMPEMDGYETAIQLKKSYESIQVLVITMIEDERTMIKMLQMGIKGYLSKDVEPAELKKALTSIVNKGFYYTDYVTGKLIDAVQNPVPPDKQVKISERELEFLKHACSEYTYKEIADMMCLSIKTIDGYRNNLFEKLEIKSRTGLAIYALKNKLVEV